MRHITLLAACAALTVAVPATAQSEMRTRDDSLALGRKYVAWVYESYSDSLWNLMGPRMREVVGSRDAIQEKIDELLLQFGGEAEVLSETAEPRAGNVLYTREVRFEVGLGEPGVWLWEIAPDGTIMMAEMMPKSRVQQQQRAEPAKPDSAPKPAQ